MDDSRIPPLLAEPGTVWCTFVFQWNEECGSKEHLAYDIDDLLDVLATDAMHREYDQQAGAITSKALEPTWITSRQIEAGRRAMTRNARRGGKIWVRIFPDKPVTVRPAETRMGSDNSGARELMCIRIIGASNRRYAHIGDVIVAVIKDAVPNMPLERSEVVRAVIVRTCKELKRDNGMIIRYDDNTAVVIDQEGNPKGTRVFGAIARELRQFNFTKIVSLAPEVL
ncbi:uncharacterized protein LOC143566664 [Bidens hawaiensis]|uniref:uncharacterized protein LOC143566664 n=1 Tax=Bidens hawaiensis TaxID=980011 RepID=UPI00404B8BA1